MRLVPQSLDGYKYLLNIQSTIFSTLHANSGYWQLKIEVHDIYIQDYISIDYRFTSLHSHALWITKCLKLNQMYYGRHPVKRQIAIRACLIVQHRACSKTPEQHVIHVINVFSLQYNARATRRLRNCSFTTPTIDYLGHAICPRRLELASHTENAFHGHTHANSLIKVRFLLGFCNVIRWLVRNMGRAAPMLK